MGTVTTHLVELIIMFIRIQPRDDTHLLIFLIKVAVRIKCIGTTLVQNAQTLIGKTAVLREVTQ